MPNDLVNAKTALQLYNNVIDNVGHPSTVEHAIRIITTKLQKETNLLRSEQTKEIKDLLKKKLPAVTWSGDFDKRVAKALRTYSNLLCIDIDKLSPDDLLNIRATLHNDPYTFICFTSPSGNGIKVIIKVDGGATRHLDNFKSIEHYYQVTYNLAIDPSGKDVNRLCFLCHDADLYINWNSLPFDKVIDFSTADITKAEGVEFEQSYDDELTSILTFTEKKRNYRDGRNNFIYLFACNCNRKGVSIVDCTSFVFTFATDADMKTKEIEDTIKSAYKHHPHETGKFKRIPRTTSRKTTAAVSQQAANGSQQTTVQEPATETADDGGVLIKRMYEHLQVLTQRIVHKGKDITSNLGADWTTVYMTYGIFGIGARQHYHIVCQLAKDYDYDSCDEKFVWACENSKYKSLAKFKKIAAYYEIDTSFEDERIDGEEGLYWLPASVDKNLFLQTGFYALIDNVKTGYYFRTGESSATPISNFVVTPLMHVYSKTDNKRILQINNGIHTKTLDLSSKSLISLDGFCEAVTNEGNFIFYGSKQQLQRILRSILEHFQICYELKTLGWQPEGFFAWSNAVYIPDSEQPDVKPVEFNELGIVTVGSTSYFSPSASDIQKDVRAEDDEYENDRYLTHVSTSLTFDRWSAMMKAVYSDDAILGIAYVFIGLFKDLVYKIDNNCPLLFAYGEKGSGKSKFAESVASVFLKDLQPFNLNHGTDFAFFNRLSRFRNCVTWFDEFDDQAIKEDRFQSIKGAYDGSGRERGKGTNKNKTEIAKINSALLLTGQYLSTRDDNAALTRCLIIAFTPNDNRTPEQILNYDALKSAEKKGITGILTELLALRPMMQNLYAAMFPENFNELRSAITADGKSYKERVLRNYTAVLTLWKLAAGAGIALPFTYAQVFSRCKQDVVKLSRTISESDSLADFWNTVEFLLETGQIQEGFHFRVQQLTQVETLNKEGGKIHHPFQEPTRVLFIRLTTIHKLYMEAFRKQHGKNGIDRSSLELYISSSAAYMGGKKSYKFHDQQKNELNTSCDVFQLDKLSITLERAAPGEDQETPMVKITGTLMGEAKLTDYLNKAMLKFTLKEDASYADPSYPNQRVEKFVFYTVYLNRDEQAKVRTGNEMEITGQIFARTYKDSSGKEHVKLTLVGHSATLKEQQIQMPMPDSGGWKAVSQDLPFD